MRISNSFIPALHKISEDEKTLSHQLMLRSGMIRQVTKGIFCWLPIGLKVLEKVSRIVREEQNRIGANEIHLPVLQPSSLWKESNRYDDYGKEMLKIYDRENNELVYAPTNEELICSIFKKDVQSYCELPKLIYCLGSKFRDEIRPRFGVMRGREFIMKDTYSFDLTEADAIRTYYKVFTSYLRTFQRLGLPIIPVQADSGPIGGNLSHEFVLLHPKGESKILYDEQIVNLKFQDSENYEETFAKFTKFTCTNKEEDFKNRKPEWKEGNGIELGHVFYFGTKYSEPMDVTVTGPDGEKIIPFMGSYGIGISRVIATIIEHYNDKYGIIWPESIAPYKIAIINLSPANESVNNICNKLYNSFNENNIECIYHDTKESVGSKFALIDLIGIPYQIIIGEKELAADSATLKIRSQNKKHTININQAFNIEDTIANIK